MAGIVEKPDAGAFERIGELADAAFNLALAKIVAFNDFEADGTQIVGDVEGVVDRIGQRAGLGISTVADDERHPPPRPGIGAQQQKSQKRPSEDCKPAHEEDHSATHPGDANRFEMQA